MSQQLATYSDSQRPLTLTLSQREREQQSRSRTIELEQLQLLQSADIEPHGCGGSRKTEFELTPATPLGHDHGVAMDSAFQSSQAGGWVRESARLILPVRAA